MKPSFGKGIKGKTQTSALSPISTFLVFSSWGQYWEAAQNTRYKRETRQSLSSFFQSWYLMPSQVPQPTLLSSQLENLDVWCSLARLLCSATQICEIIFFGKDESFLVNFPRWLCKNIWGIMFPALFDMLHCFLKTSFASNAVRMFPAMTNHLLCSNKSGAALRHKKSCQLRKFSHNVCSAPQLNLFSKVW